MNVVFYIVILFSIAEQLSASEDMIKDIQRVSYGVSIVPSFSDHRADMLPPKPMSICCPTFTNGNDLGYDLSFFAKYVIDYDHSIGASFGYRDISATFITESFGIVNSKKEKGFIKSSLETELSLIHFQLLYNLSPIQRFDITLGILVGINASKNYSYRENIVNDVILFDNSTQQRNVSLGALAGINPRYFGIVFGTSYKLPIIKDELFIKPLIHYTYALRPVQFGTNWFADALNIGLGIELHPFGELQRPQKEYNANIDVINVAESPITSSIKIGEISLGTMRINRKVHTMPVLDDLYSDILTPHTAQSIPLENCIDDHGSCYYPWIFDTLSKRMQKYPQTRLHILMPEGIESEVFIKRVKDYAFERNIDTARINISYVQDLASQKIAKIINNELMSPYQTVSFDTSYTNSSIQFLVASQKNLNFEWGLYDINTKLLVKKGIGSCNVPVFIDSIPTSFITGSVRALIFDEGKKELIQKEVIINKPEIVLSDPILYETAALFEFNSDKLRKIDIESLQYFMNSLSSQDTIIIEAFTDLSGDIDLNTELAKRRAESVSSLFKETPKEIILSPLKPRNSGIKEYQKAYNRIVTIKRK